MNLNGQINLICMVYIIILSLLLLNSLRINNMQPENDPNKNKNQMFKQMYKSAIRPSYFHGIQNPDFIKKSKIQMQTIASEEEKNVDEKTFRMMKGFKRPDDTFKIYSKRGNVMLESSGFLCFGKGRTYPAEINNTKFSIKNGDQILRFADFSAVSAQVLEKGDKIIIAFDDAPKDRCIQFEVADKNNDNHKNWTKLLYQIIQKSSGKQKNYTYLATKCPNFYKSQHILNSEFENRANTGDILLFRSPHSAARAQRVVTNSQYDHVAIVLRNSKNQLFIFESTSDEGVGMTPWKHLVKYEWYSQTQKICWRPLNAQLADYEVEVIEAFVAKTIGKQFQLNMNKLFQFTSKLQRTKQDEENRTYFCSQLAARLYKQLKFIDGDISSTSYYPIDFSGKGTLKFVKPGVSLGNQKIIAFQKN